MHGIRNRWTGAWLVRHGADGWGWTREPRLAMAVHDTSTAYAWMRRAQDAMAMECLRRRGQLAMVVEALPSQSRDLGQCDDTGPLPSPRLGPDPTDADRLIESVSERILAPEHRERLRLIVEIGSREAAFVMARLIVMGVADAIANDECVPLEIVAALCVRYPELDHDRSQDAGELMLRAGVRPWSQTTTPAGEMVGGAS